MFSQIGLPEILILFLIALLVFGAKRLPEMGAAMGKGIREFKKNIRDVKESIEGDDEESALPSARRLDARATEAESREPKKLSQ